MALSHVLYDLPAPAKLNLFLHVVGRRTDGYHLLESVFALIDWYDTLHIERTQSPSITRTDLSEPLPAEDLTVRAARLLQTYTGCRYGAHIHVHKTIPSQAGLGGGSSDAATTLLALCRRWQLSITREQLMQLGLQLGADVPFFLQGQNAWVRGIGERITPFDLPAMSYWVMKPPRGLSTPLIFQAPDLVRDTPVIASLNWLTQQDLRTYGRNDLQAVALRLCPELATGLSWLTQQGLTGRMSGSGTALFAPCSPHFIPSHEALLPDWIMRRCHLLTTHPLVKL